MVDTEYEQSIIATEMVLAEYPFASDTFNPYDPEYPVAVFDGRGNLLGRGKSFAGAWIDAATRMEERKMAAKDIEVEQFWSWPDIVRLSCVALVVVTVFGWGAWKALSFVYRLLVAHDGLWGVGFVVVLMVLGCIGLFVNDGEVK